VVTRYLTCTFGPISITFIQPFLDDTSRTLMQAVLRPKKVNLKGGPTFPEGVPECWNCATCSENWGRKRSEKYFEPPIIAKIIFGTFFPKNVVPTTPPPPSHPFTFYWKIFAYQKIFWGGPERKFTIHPTRYRLARPGSNTLFVTGIFQNGTQTFTQSNYIS
jgi:hypothetical protein